MLSENHNENHTRAAKKDDHVYVRGGREEEAGGRRGGGENQTLNQSPNSPLHFERNKAQFTDTHYRDTSVIVQLLYSVFLRVT